MSNLSKNLSKNSYNNSEDTGKTYASIGMLIGCCICTIFCMCAISNLMSSNSSVNITARVTQVTSCTLQGSNYSCNLQVTYLVNNTPYTNSITLQNPIQYSLNDNVNISYDPSNPNKIGPPVSDNKVSGSCSMVIASLIICSCTVNYFLASSSKSNTTASSFSTTVGNLKK